MCASGLLPTLVNVLRDHLDDRDVTKAALLALETMALLPENVEELLKLGAIGKFQRVVSLSLSVSVELSVIFCCGASNVCTTPCLLTRLFGGSMCLFFSLSLSTLLSPFLFADWIGLT